MPFHSFPQRNQTHQKQHQKTRNSPPTSNSAALYVHKDVSKNDAQNATQCINTTKSIIPTPFDLSCSTSAQLFSW
ncbi:MAG TPA: hypothetical protein DCE42_22345 [Myxococcales bacterium]|nr:hypothetical protein [Deltaproteobacteria bacterium]MBU54518.1 hypothetical protein [Deltaproteobacteria bacterium]HAA57523.1 hypothetical protein [Myxococcales bacterium]